MRFNYFFKILLLFHIFYSLNVRAISCPITSTFGGTGDEATIIASTETHHVNEVNHTLIDFIYADAMDIEFWIAKCVEGDEVEYSLVVTVNPSVPGYSRGVGVFDIAVIQNGQ